MTIEIKKEFEDLDGYYDFTNGNPVSDHELKMWIRNGLDFIAKTLKDSPEKQHVFFDIHTGNRKVFVIAYRHENDPNRITLHIDIVRSFSTKWLTGVNISDL